MGQIASTYDLMPESTEIDLQGVIAKLKEVLPAGVELKETSIKPVAFGLEKVVAFMVIDDTDESIGGKLEDAMRGIPGISEIACVDSTNL
ncbi:MAG: translation elongation factor EF-1beta [Candidatus Methanomethylophilaceae archaeon]|nr:translation elongation factor EF-1beta [Candidatus Methanomethylophilaceae archaeon]